MGGFVESYMKRSPPPADRSAVMGYYAKDAVPVFDFFARNFAVCDHWFSALPTGTQANRLMAMSGYSLVDRTQSGYFQIAQDLFHNNPDDLVYDWLSARGISWRVYLAGYSFFFMQMPRVLSLYEGDVQEQNLFRPIDRLIEDFQNGDLPQVLFIEPFYQTIIAVAARQPPMTIPRRLCTAVNDY